jgi:cell division protein FtsW (lipid II flippase)
MLQHSLEFSYVVKVTVIAALHVLILVASRDLGGALIYLMTYLIMLYVATRKPAYMFLGLGSGAVASVLAYFLFQHVQDRVIAWKDPLSVIDDQGYQISQSLFAIGSGGWFGVGLGQGMPDKIPVVTTDFVFSAISEEMGAVFALCLIFVCISCFLMFFNIAMQVKDTFYKLIALGIGALYGTQTFLALGGVTKFIPSTGVTLPLVSYGGSSLLSTVILFAIIQGLYVLQVDEGAQDERTKKPSKNATQRC